MLHEVAGPLAEFAQSLYDLLVVHADDWGRQAGDLFTLRYRVDPTSPRSMAEFAAALEALQRVGMIAWYDAEMEGATRKVLEIWNFDAHQTGLHKRTASRFPPAPPGTSGNFLGIPLKEGTEGTEGTELKKELKKEPKGTKSGVRAAALSVPEATKTSESAAPKTALPDPETKPDPDENVEVITTLVQTEILPLNMPDDELVEATKARCAQLHIAYTGQVVGRAIASAQFRRHLQTPMFGKS